MDIGEIKANDRVIEITHPESEENIGLRITVRSEYHPEVKKAQRANLDGQLQSKKSKLTAAQIEKNNEALSVACVGGWEWYGEATLEGEKPECTPDNVKKLYKKAPWIKDQVRAEFDDTAAFFRA